MDVSCLDDRALASNAILRRKGAHGPEGMLNSVDFDMPTPVMKSQEGEHVPKGVQTSVDTEMPTHMKEQDSVCEVSGKRSRR